MLGSRKVWCDWSLSFTLAMRPSGAAPEPRGPGREGPGRTSCGGGCEASDLSAPSGAETQARATEEITEPLRK